MKNLSNNIKEIIQFLGDNPERKGLENTPSYVMDFYKDFFDGYKSKVKDFAVTFPHTSDLQSTQEVTIRSIHFYSMCEHHLLPFSGIVKITYIPNNLLLGFSEFIGIVNMYAHRLQVQERFIQNILSAVVEILDPLHCEVVVKASHLCMKMRGERDKSSIAISKLTYDKHSNL